MDMLLGWTPKRRRVDQFFVKHVYGYNDVGILSPAQQPPHHTPYIRRMYTVTPTYDTCIMTWTPPRAPFFFTIPHSPFSVSKLS